MGERMYVNDKFEVIEILRDNKYIYGVKRIGPKRFITFMRDLEKAMETADKYKELDEMFR